METKIFLKISKVTTVDDTILDSRIIADKIYIKTKDNLSVLNDSLEELYTNYRYYLDALDEKNNHLVYIATEKNKQELVCRDEKNIESKIKIEKEVKKIFMFYEHGYGIILYEDSSLAIYSIALNKIISNVSLDEELVDMFKSFSTSEMVFVSKKSISFFNIRTVKISRKIQIEDDNYIDLSIHGNKVYLIYSDKIRIIKKDTKPVDLMLNFNDIIVQVFTNINQKEIIFITQNNTIYLYHLVSNSIFRVFKYEEKIESIRFMESDIFLVSLNKIIKIDTTQGGLEFEKHLVLEEITEAFQVLEDNPFLILDEMFFNKLSKLWEERYHKISNKLLMNKLDEAQMLFSKFEVIHTCKSDFDELISLSGIFIDLNKAMRTMDYAEVFYLIERYNSLKQTPIGKKIITDWEHNFEKFLFSLLKNKFNKEGKEYKILQKYLMVSNKKDIIEFAIEHQNVILSAVQAFKNKKYALYTNLLEKYKSLNELPITKRIETISRNLYLKVLNQIKQNELNEALELLETLQNFNKYKAQSMLLKEKVNVYLGFEASFKKSNMERCRMFVEQYSEHFENSSYYFKLVAIDLRKIESSLLFIDNNDFENSYLILQEFFRSKIWSSKVKYLMVRYYIQQYKYLQFELTIKEQKEFAEKFYEIFGYFDETFPKQNITENKPKREDNEQIVNYPKTLI